MPEMHPDLPAGYQYRPEFETTPREAARQQQGGIRFVIIDVREKEELTQAPLVGAVHIPLGQLEARWDELEIEADEPFGVMCKAGIRSLKATLFLQHMGLTGARSIAGGMDLWAVQIKT